ncbi:MAG: phage protease [Proteobacteria bacterium]|nr:phage protease [Pseudomonadota bacterium]
MKTDANTLAALTLELVPSDGDIVPTEVHLLPRGPFRAVDDRPHECPNWLLDERIAAKVIACAEAKVNDTLIDYEHQSLNSGMNGQPTPAAGWFRALEWRDTGLYATGVKWTARARQMIAAREYRYISAVFHYLPRTGEVLDIVSVALTNTPALDGLEALAAARKLTPQPPLEDAEMADEKELAALTSERDSLKTSVAALTAERNAAVAELAVLKAKEAEAALTAEKAERTKLLEDIAPALRCAVESLPLASLKEYVEKAGSLGLLNRQTGKEKPATAALTQEEADLCEKFGVSRDEFAASRNARKE